MFLQYYFIELMQSIQGMIKQEILKYGCFTMPNLVQLQSLKEKSEIELQKMIIEKYQHRQSEGLMLLFDIVIENDQGISIRTCTLGEIQKKQIQIDPSTTFRFKLAQLKQIKLLCICQDHLSREEIYKFVKQSQAKKSHKYTTEKVYLVRQETEIEEIEKEEFQKLPKKKAEKSPVKSIVKEKEEKQQKRRKLMFKASSSESQEYYFPKKEKTQCQDNKSPHQKGDKLKLNGEVSTGFHHIESQKKERRDSKQSKKSRTNSLPLQKNDSKSNLPKATSKALSKASKKQTKKQQMKKQSNFMSNWFTKKSSQ